jgi:hypothetical protein
MNDIYMLQSTIFKFYYVNSYRLRLEQSFFSAFFVLFFITHCLPACKIYKYKDNTVQHLTVLWVLVSFKNEVELR